VQLALMFAYAVAAGWRPARPALRHAEVSRLLRLLVRPSAAATLNPVTRVAETVVASFLPPGSATVLHYGQRAVSAVGGTVLFRSVMLAVLPRLTRAHVLGDVPSRRRLADLGMQLMVIVSFPLTAITLVLAMPATEELLGIGRFSAEDARLLGVVLTVLALSFPLSAVQRGLLAPFYAARNTRVPLHNTVVGAAVNLALLGACLAFGGDGSGVVVAIAGAYVVANVANVLHARWAVGRSGLGVPRAGHAVVLRSSASAVAGAGAAWVVWAETGLAPVWRLLAAGLAGVVAVLVVELPGRVRRPARRTVTGASGIAVAALVAGTAATASALSFVAGRGMAAALLPVGVLVGLAVLALALARFDVFVLALLAGRTSMDAFKGASGSSFTEPATLVGLLFLGAGLMWLAAQWREDGVIRLSRLGWAVVGFAAAALVGVVVAPVLWPAFVEWVRLASVCTMVLVAERLGRTPGFREKLMVAFAAAAVVPLIVGAWQLQTGAGLFDAGGFGRVRGTFTHSNPMAAFLAVLVVMAFAYVAHLRDEAYRLGAAVVFVAASAGLYVTYTRAAWLAAILGIAIVACTKGRRWVIGGAVVVLMLMFAVPGAAARFSDLGEADTARGEPSNSLTWRAEYWGEALQLSSESPVTGIGLKQVVEESSESKQPHNDYLRAYVELGVVGLLAFGWMMTQMLATGVRAMRATAGGRRRDRAFAVGCCGVAAGYLLMSLVANLMSQVVVGIYFAAIVGAASALADRRAPVPDEQPVLEEVEA
jgi:putative inorganic carbon (HCO3(-)) transporter